MFEGLKKFVAIKAVRWASTLIAGSVAGWLSAHSDVMAWVNTACMSLSDPTKLGAELGSAGVALTTLFFSVKDVVTVNDKQTAAAITGSVVAANNPTIRKDVVAAVKSGEIPPPPKDISEIVAERMNRARGGD